MKIASYDIQNGVLSIYLEGELNSTTAPQLEDDLFSLIKEKPPCAIVLDLDQVSYVSSAGLRVVLRLKKVCPSLRITRTSGEIYKVFEMTGFTNLIEIERK